MSAYQPFAGIEPAALFFRERNECRRLPLNGNRTGFRPTEAGQKSKAEKEKTTAKQSFYSFRPLFLRLSFTLQRLYGGEVSDLGRV